jgi:hypothetical protein
MKIKSPSFLTLQFADVHHNLGNDMKILYLIGRKRIKLDQTMYQKEKNLLIKKNHAFPDASVIKV